jgi:hypothetical protein
MKTKSKKIIKNKTKKRFFFNPNDKKNSFDVYIDKNPKDTINIKYKTVKDVQQTIKKLENLYKSNKYSHKRIWQVAMIMKVRLEVIYKKRDKYPNSKDIYQRYQLAKKYYNFLKKRTRQNEIERKKMIFR